MKKILIIAWVMVVSATATQAQSTDQPLEPWQTIFFESPGIAIPLLTEAVISHSAQLKGLELDKQINQQQIKIARRNILDGVAAGAVYSYGNLGSLGTPAVGNPNQLNTFNSSRYSAGVNLSLSLGQLLSRSNRIAVEKINLERSETTRQDREDQLRQVVIQAYQNVVLARKLLLLQQEAYLTVQSTYRLTEKQFKQGQLALPDFAMANAQVTSTAAAQETARNQYETAVLLLEEMAGAKLSTIMTAK